MFKGWVPTVTGRLSFSSMGRATHPTLAICSNIADSQTRYIISYQKRPLLDAVLPFKYTLGRLFLGLEGDFWLLCLAKSSNHVIENGGLAGSIMIFHGSKAWRGAVEDRVKQLQEYVEGYYYEGESTPLESYLDSSFQDANSFLRKHSSFNVDFTLARNGVCTIKVPSPLIVSEKAPTFPPEHKDGLEHIVCSQSFFFLKDIAHSHQHHSPQTDTLIDIFRIKKGSDDYLWMSETLRVLYRKVLQFKRGHEEEVYSSSLGILAYIKSFISIAKKEAGKDLEPQLDINSLEFSIRANQEKVRTRIQNEIRKSDSLRNTIIGLIGLLVSFVGLTSLSHSPEIASISPHAFYFKASKFLLEEPLISFSTFASIYVGILLSMKIIDYTKWSWVRGVIRAFQPLKQKVFASILFVVALLIALATYTYVFK